MADVQDALYGRMADQITNSFTDEMLAPLLEAMQKGKSLPEALAAVDWTQVKSKFQQTVDDVSAIFNNAQVTSGIGALKGAIQDLFSTSSYSIPKGWILAKDDTTKAATGGLITGPGTGTSDSVPAMLSNGEYVIKASSAAKLGTGFLNAINAGQLPKTVNRAEGGMVWDDPVTFENWQAISGTGNTTININSGYFEGGLIADSRNAPSSKEAATDYTALESDAAQTYIDALRAMGEVYTANTLALAKATEGFDALHVAMYREIEAGKVLVSMREALAQSQKDYAASEVELLKAKGNNAGAAALQRSLDLADVSAKRASAQLRLLDTDLSENEKSYQTAIVATADATAAQYDLTKAREAEISAAGRLLSATKGVASSRVKLLQAGGSKGEADANQRAIDLADTFDSLNAASSRLATAGLSETERAVLLNTVAADLQTVAQNDLGKALETTTEHVTAAVSGLKNLQDSFETLNVSALTALGDKSGAGAAQKAIDLKPVNEAAAAAQTLLNSGTVTDADVKAGLELTVNTAKLADAQYDLNTALTAGIAGLTSVKGALEGFQKTGDDLVIQKTRLTGDDEGADVLQRSSDLKDVFKVREEAVATLASDGITPLQRSVAEAAIATADAAEAQYDRNKDLTDEIEILGRYKSVKEDADATNIELMKAMGNTAGAFATELSKATKGFNDAQIATYRQTQANKGLIAAYGNLSNTANMVTNSRIGLLTAKGDTAGAAALQRELDIAPYVKAIADANSQLSTATTQLEKDSLNSTIALNKGAIGNLDLSKSLDKEAQAATEAKAATDSLAQAYADMRSQIEQAKVALLRASGDTTAADELEFAIATREHAGDVYYESLYRELVTLRKLTEARQQLNTLEDSALQNQIKLQRANGEGILANAIERSAFLKNAALPAAAAKAELDRSNVSWRDFLASKNTTINPQWVGMGDSVAANLASGATSASALQSLTTFQESGYGPNALPEDLRKLLYEFGLNQRTESQKANLQGVVDTAQSIAASYDRNKALEAELKIIELQDEAYKQNLDAQKAVTDAQKAYADVLKSTISTMQDFLKTLDGAATPTQSLSQARLDFRNLSQRAASGDTSVYKDLTPAAKTFLDLSKNYSRSIQDYKRDEAQVRATLNAVIRVNQSELDKLPKEIAAASDPTKEAWLKLQDALNKETSSSVMLTALQVDQEASKRRLRTAEETLSDRYIESVYMLDEVKKNSLLDAFNTAVKLKVDAATLPDYSMAFDLGDIWGKNIAAVLPDKRLTNAQLNTLISEKFPGLKPSDFVTSLTPTQLSELVGGKLPTLAIENLVGAPADMVGAVKAKLNEVLPAGFAGPAFNAQAMMQTAINSVMATISSSVQPSAPPRPVVPDLTTTVVNKVQQQGLSGGTSGATANFRGMSDAEVAAMFNLQPEWVNDAATINQLYTAYSKSDAQTSQHTAALLLEYKKVRGFAVGTNYVPQDMLAQIHEGEAIIPAPFNPERYAMASGNTALIEEIKALRAEVGRLREEQRAGQNAIAANTRKTAQILVKFDTDGMPATQT